MLVRAAPTQHKLTVFESILVASKEEPECMRRSKIPYLIPLGLLNTYRLQSCLLFRDSMLTATMPKMAAHMKAILKVMATMVQQYFSCSRA